MAGAASAHQAATATREDTSQQRAGRTAPGGAVCGYPRGKRTRPGPTRQRRASAPAPAGSPRTCPLLPVGDVAQRRMRPSAA